ERQGERADDVLDHAVRGAEVEPAGVDVGPRRLAQATPSGVDREAVQTGQARGHRHGRESAPRSVSPPRGSNGRSNGVRPGSKDAGASGVVSQSGGTTAIATSPPPAPQVLTAPRAARATGRAARTAGVSRSTPAASPRAAIASAPASIAAIAAAGVVAAARD